MSQTEPRLQIDLRRWTPVLSRPAWASALAGCAMAAVSLPAEADGPCSAIGASAGETRAWFADPRLPRRPSGARLKRIDRAVEITLKPMAAVDFFLPPSSAPRSGAYGGMITFFGVPRPAVYRVSLSNRAEIDVFENGARIHALASTAAPDCPDVEASALFRLAPGDRVLVQISNAPNPTIKAAFAEAH